MKTTVMNTEYTDNDANASNNIWDIIKILHVSMYILSY